MEEFRHLLVVRFSQDPELFDLPPEEIAWLKEKGENVSETSLDQLFRMLEHALPGILRSPVPGIMLEVLLLRLCHYDELQPLAEILKQLDSVRAVPVLSAGRQVAPLPKEKSSSSPEPVRGPEKGWPQFLQEIRNQRPQLGSLLDASQGAELKGQEVLFSYPPGSIHLEMVREPERLRQIEELLSRFFGRPLKAAFAEKTGEPESTGLVDEAVSIFQPQSLKTVRRP